MKKTTIFFVSGLMALSAIAQIGVTLNPADYSVPTWTLLQRKLEEMKNASMPYSINMTVNGDPTTRIAVSWFTNSDCTDGMVQVIKADGTSGVDFTNPLLTVEAAAELTTPLNYSTEKNNLKGVTPGEKVVYCSHKALLTNLAPGTTYYYRVGKDGAWSDVGHFTTATTSPDYEFIYITDTQAQNDEMFNVSQKTVHAALAMVPEAAFVLCNGDLVETSGANNSEWEYEQWFSTMQDVWLNYPLVVTQGNHDTSTNSNFAWHFNNDNSFNETSAVKTAIDGTVFSFEMGNTLYMVINYEDWKTPGYFDALSAWMRRQVANSNAKWRIASFHKNMFTGSRSHQSDADGRAVREAMLPVFGELNIDVALQGHDHIYEVIGPVRASDMTLVESCVQKVENVSDGGSRENMTGKAGGEFNVYDGTLFFLNNSAGKKKYEPRSKEDMEAAIETHNVNNYWGLFSGKFGQTGEPTFTSVKVTSDRITFTTYTVDDNGTPTQFDSFDVIKDNLSSVDAMSASGVKISYLNDIVTLEGADCTSIKVYSTSGMLMASGSGNSIDIAHLDGGAYIVQATAADSTYTSKISK